MTHASGVAIGPPVLPKEMARTLESSVACWLVAADQLVTPQSGIMPAEMNAPPSFARRPVVAEG